MDEAMFLANNSVDSGSAPYQLFAQPGSNVASSFPEWDSLNVSLENSVAMNEPLYCYNWEPEADPMEDGPLPESMVAMEQDEEEAMPLLVLGEPTEHTDLVLREAINNGLLEGNLMLDWIFPKEEENGGVEEVTVPLLVPPNFLNASGINQTLELKDFVLHEATHNGVPEDNLLPHRMFQEVKEVAVPPLVPEGLVQEPATQPTFGNPAEVPENMKFRECVLREAIDTEAEQRLLEGDLVPSWMLRGAMSNVVYIRKSFGTKPYSEYYCVVPADSNERTERVPNRLPKPELTEDPVVIELVNDPAEESAIVDRMLARADDGAAFEAPQESKPKMYKYYNLSVVGNMAEPTPPKPSRKRPRKRMVLTKSPDRPKMTSKMRC